MLTTVKLVRPTVEVIGKKISSFGWRYLNKTDVEFNLVMNCKICSRIEQIRGLRIMRSIVFK